MNFTAKIIAGFLHGTIEGDEHATVHDVAKIEEGRAGALSFLANPKYEKYLYTSESSVIIVNEDQRLTGPVKATLIRVKNAYEAFAALLNMYEQSKVKKQGISNLSSISKEATLGDAAYVGEFTVIAEGAKVGREVQLYPQVYVGENVTIGDGCILYPGVKIYHDCTIGKNCILHSGVVIGGDGFGFVPDENNVYSKLPQLGNVIIEDNVEIGANTTVDRATMGSTIIRNGVKLDNLIMVAHNVEIGENTVMAGQVGIAGSTKVGDNCQFGGQVGLAGHIRIANGAKIGAQAGLHADVKEENAAIIGSPAFDIKGFYRSSAVFKKLPELQREFYALKRKVESEGK